MRILTIVIVIMFMFVSLSANICFNQGQCLFESQCCSNCRSAYNVEGIIVESGSNLILANSSYQLFLNKVELSDMYGVDFQILKGYLKTAIENLENAEGYYAELVDASEKLSYNEKNILRLKHFDYKSDTAIPLIWERVKSFLQNGDVKGAFKNVHTDCTRLLQSLYEVDSNLSKGVLPIEDIMRANQLFFEIQLFGQYSAEVFHLAKF